MRAIPRVTLRAWSDLSPPGASPACAPSQGDPSHPHPCSAPPGDPLTGAPRAATTDGSEAEEDPHKRRKQLLSVLVGLAAMLGYAFLSGIVSIQRGSVGPAGRQPVTLEEEEEEEEE